MPRYYFNLHDAKTTLDQHGTDLHDLEAARREAIMIFRDILKGDDPATVFWAGSAPWKIWVTDEPEGKGTTLLTLQLKAS